MSDEAYRIAESKKTQIKQRLAQIQAEADGLRTELDELEQFTRMWHILVSGEVPPAVAEPEKPAPVKNPPKEEVGDAVERIIRERGTPIPRRHLFNALAEAGIIIQGKEPEMVLSTMLWRMPDRFVRLPRVGYWLQTEDYPEAGYRAGSGKALYEKKVQEWTAEAQNPSLLSENE